MKFFKTLYISQIWMALTAVAFLWTSGILIGAQQSPWLWVSAFFGAWSIYILDGYVGSEREDLYHQPVKSHFFRRYKRLAGSVAFGAIFISGLSFFLSRRFDFLPVIAVLAFLGLLYVVPFPAQRRSIRIKDFAVLKVTWISLAWLVGGMGFFIQPGLPVSLSIGNVALVHFVLLALDTMALDVRDQVGDTSHGIITSAHFLGQRPLSILIFSTVIVFISLIFSVLFLYITHLQFIIISLECLTFVLSLYFIQSRKNLSPLTFGFLVSLWRIIGFLAAGIATRAAFH